MGLFNWGRFSVNPRGFWVVFCKLLILLDVGLGGLPKREFQAMSIT